MKTDDHEGRNKKRRRSTDGVFKASRTTDKTRPKSKAKPKAAAVAAKAETQAALPNEAAEVEATVPSATPEAMTAEPISNDAARRLAEEQMSPALLEPRAESPSAPETTPTMLPASAAKASHHYLRWGTVTLSLVVIALSLWLAAGYFGARVAIGPSKVPARLSDAVLAQDITSATRRYTLRIADPAGKIQSFTLQDVGLKVSANTAVAQLRQATHTWKARLLWWRPVSAQLVAPAQKAALNDFIAKHVSEVVQPAHDATLTIANGQAQVSDASAGKQYGLDNAADTILAHVNQLSATPLKVHVVALQPAVTKQALASVQAQLQHVLHQHITIGAAGQTTTPTANDIAGWLTLTPDLTHKTVSVQVAADKVQSYMTQVAAQNSHPPHAQLTNGNAVIPGEQGVTVTGAQDAAASIAKQVLAAKGAHVDLPSTRTSFKTVTAPLSGKWIEVDLTTKRMYAYQQTSVAHSFLVSAGAPATPTVVGTFSVYAKFPSQNMYGAGADGARYFQPNVPWVNYFYRDFAIHGNYWRPASYFGNINASHGCVGVNDSDAAWVYKWAPIGTPVVVHT